MTLTQVRTVLIYYPFLSSIEGLNSGDMMHTSIGSTANEHHLIYIAPSAWRWQCLRYMIDRELDSLGLRMTLLVYHLLPNVASRRWL
jgi:hypothetical protein